MRDYGTKSNMFSISPSIILLNRTRIANKLTIDIATDLAIIGGGIAGVASTCYTLRHTDKKVVLVEANKISHGATGHNAGQIVSYFGRPLAELESEFEMELTGKNGRLLLNLHYSS